MQHEGVGHVTMPGIQEKPPKMLEGFPDLEQPPGLGDAEASYEAVPEGGDLDDTLPDGRMPEGVFEQPVESPVALSLEESALDPSYFETPGQEPGLQLEPSAQLETPGVFEMPAVFESPVVFEAPEPELEEPGQGPEAFTPLGKALSASDSQLDGAEGGMAAFFDDFPGEQAPAADGKRRPASPRARPAAAPGPGSGPGLPGSGSSGAGLKSHGTPVGLFLFFLFLSCSYMVLLYYRDH